MAEQSWVNPYIMTLWEDHILDPNETDPLTGEPFVIQEGTRFTANRANNIEEGIYNLYGLFVSLQREIDRLKLKTDLNDRTLGDNTFFDNLDGATLAHLLFDDAMADVTSALAVGATVIPVDKPEEFAIKTEITIYDDVNMEEAYISAINIAGKTITVTAPLTKAYKRGAKVARSNVVIDGTANEMRIASWGTFSIAVTEVL